ncbi:MAG: YcgL domain-containing protein [Gammaproteobacteria bacterium]|nr:YcgL domain-containing protein [Gammaproteobacteria bacterium]
MLCAIYKSSKKDEMYLYVPGREDFGRVPEALMAVFGAPQLVTVLKLSADKALAREDAQKVMENLKNQGFHLQMPPPQENWLAEHRAERGLGALPERGAK